jgi:hypothetical protein
MTVSSSYTVTGWLHTGGMMTKGTNAAHKNGSNSGFWQPTGP